MAAFNHKITFAVLLMSLIVLSESTVNYNCKPGEDFKDLCNTCTCADNGKDALCTRMACIPPGEPGFACTPHENFKYKCNTCICSSDGKSAACTRMECITDE